MTSGRRETTTLEEARRELVEGRIIRAARTALSEHGLDARTEDIAAIAGVGRRTIFRYFSTRDQLFVAALHSAINEYLQNIPERGDQDVWTWLDALARSVTEGNASYGLGYWQLVLQTDVNGPFGAALAQRRARRQSVSREIAEEAWSAAGGAGEPPEWLVEAFLLGVGPFTTAALHIDGQLTLEETARSTARLLRTVLRAALEETGG